MMIPLTMAAVLATANALDLPRHWSLQVLPTDNGRQQLCLCSQKQGLMLLVR